MIDRSISRAYGWKVQGRLAVLDYAAGHGVKPAAARFGLDRKTVRRWRDRAREAGAPGLVPRRSEAAPQRPPGAFCSFQPVLFRTFLESTRLPEDGDRTDPGHGLRKQFQTVADQVRGDDR